MGSLPSDRINMDDYKVFSITGVDFAGPITVRHHVRCRQEKKVYLSLFICFVTKAVHIELVTDLSTDAFLRSLRRFVDDRGHVTKIYSDNATNFKGACNYLQEVKQMLSRNAPKIVESCKKQHIEWSFSPPRAPHHGGLWEASIKLLKTLIRKIVGDANLTEDELRTVAKRAASIVNSRPITTLSADANDLSPFTPAHFLYGRPPTAFPEPPSMFENVININKVNVAQRMQYVNRQLWQRFQKEYLTLLQPRSKWLFKTDNVQPGTLVLVKQDNVNPLHWPLGRIIETYPDSDGLVRIVKLRTSSGEFERATNGIAVLPMDDEWLLEPQRRGVC